MLSTEKARELTERVFAAMTMRYGNKFADMWRGIDLDEVKATWSQKLAAFPIGVVAKAVDALDGLNFPPTLPEFLALCVKASGSRLPEHQPMMALPPPDTSAEANVKREAAAAKLKSMGKAEPNREWAQRALLRHQSKAYVLTPGALAIMERALQ